MSWFKFGMEKNTSSDSNNGISGPIHLDKYGQIIQNPSKLKAYEWRRKLVSTNGNIKFKISTMVNCMKSISQ